MAMAGSQQPEPLAILVRRFRGMFPKVDKVFLPNGGARSAVNCELRSGILHPRRTNRRVSSIPSAAKGILPLGDGDPFPMTYPCKYYLNGSRTLFTEENNDPAAAFAGLRYSYNSLTDKTAVPASYGLVFPSAIESSVHLSINSQLAEMLSSTYAVALRTKWLDDSNLHASLVQGGDGATQITYPFGSSITITITSPELDDDLETEDLEFVVYRNLDGLWAEIGTVPYTGSEASFVDRETPGGAGRIYAP